MVIESADNKDLSSFMGPPRVAPGSLRAAWHGFLRRGRTCAVDGPMLPEEA